MRSNNFVHRWHAGCLALGLVLVAGCHGDTAQGGAEDRGRSGTSAPTKQPPRPASAGTPPSADRIDPDAPRAVLDGTSTTSPGTPTRPSTKATTSSRITPQASPQ